MLLIDADLYLYRATAATEQEICWDEDEGSNLWSLDTDLKQAKQLFRDQLEHFKDTLKDTSFLLCLSSATNFRKQVCSSYKGNRKKTRKPLGYRAMVEWAIVTYPTVTLDSLEADDVMGIMATKPENIGKAVIVSDDKDMKTIPSKLYRPMTDERLDVSLDDADKAFLTQCLTGDPTDGYAGLKGFGPKTAEKLLGSRPTWSTVEQAYIKAGHTKEEALIQARLARILRWSDWDIEEQQPILFNGGTDAVAA